jgi:hypothetical protein
MPPDGVAIALAVLLSAGAAYAEWVAWVPAARDLTRTARPRLETLAVHAAALLQLVAATALILAS